MSRRRTSVSVIAAALCLGVLGGCGSAEPPTGGAAVAAVTNVPNSAGPAEASTPSAAASTQPATAESTRPAASETPAPPAAGAYIGWSDYEKNPATAAGKVVLFFHAGWCPSCQETERNLTSAPVPAGLTVVKVDFDSSTELRQRYGVTVQHTFVQIDSSGAQLAKWSGSPDAPAILGKTV